MARPTAKQDELSVMIFFYFYVTVSRGVSDQTNSQPIKVGLGLLETNVRI